MNEEESKTYPEGVINGKAQDSWKAVRGDLRIYRYRIGLRMRQRVLGKHLGEEDEEAGGSCGRDQGDCEEGGTSCVQEGASEMWQGCQKGVRSKNGVGAGKEGERWPSV